LLYVPGGTPLIVPGGTNPDLLRSFRSSQDENVNAGLDGFDIIYLDETARPGDETIDHRIIFTTETRFVITDLSHPMSGATVSDGDLLLNNGGIILNGAILAPLDLLDTSGNSVLSLGVDALEVEGLLDGFDALANTVVTDLSTLSALTKLGRVDIILSFEEINETYIAGTSSLLPSGTEVSADDLIEIIVSSSGMAASVIRSGADKIPSTAVSILEGFGVLKNRGLDAAGNCLLEDRIYNELAEIYFSTSLDDVDLPVEFYEGDLLIHRLYTTPKNEVIATNAELTGNRQKDWGLDGVDLDPIRVGVPATPTPTPITKVTPTPTKIPPTEFPPVIPSPTVTPTPTYPLLIPPGDLGKFFITDDRESTIDLSGGTDFDSDPEPELMLRWAFREENDILDYHIYVSVDGERPAFLGRTGDTLNTSFLWKNGAERMTATAFKGGPEYGHSYSFKVYLLTKSGSPAVIGPVLTDGAVSLEYITPTPTPIPPGQSVLLVFDEPNSTIDLSGSTDLDLDSERNLTIAWVADRGAATDWHLYVQAGLDGMKFLGRTGSGVSTSFDWTKGGTGLSVAFTDGPLYNSIYSFRVIRIDGALDTKDIIDQNGLVGFNSISGGSLRLRRSAPPNLLTEKIAVYDDLLGGDNLTPNGTNGSDEDVLDSRALQIAWNFGTDTLRAADYHVTVSVDGAPFKYLGQTSSGKINYFLWSSGLEFNTGKDFRNGPQGGHTYAFRVFLIPLEGKLRSLTSGTLTYTTTDE